MLFTNRASFCAIVLTVLSFAGCNSDSNAKKNVTTAVSTESKKLTDVSPAYLAKERSESSHLPTVEFSQNGASVAYIEPLDGKYRVVHDGKPGKPYLAVTELNLSRDGKRIAYVASVSNTRNVLVVDGNEGYDYRENDNHWFTPDGQHHLSTVTQADSRYLVIDGLLNQKYRIQRTPVVSPDSRSIAMSVKSVVEGHTQVVLSDIDLTNSTVIDDCGDDVISNHDNSQVVVTCSHAGKKSLKVIDVMKRSVVSDTPYDVTVTKVKLSPYNNSLSYIYKNQYDRYIVYKGKVEHIPFGNETLSEPIVLTEPESVGVIIGDVYKAKFYRAFSGNISTGKDYGYISDFMSSRDGRHYAYIGVDTGEEKSHIVVDGHEGMKFDKIVSPLFTPDSKYLVYRARKAGKRFLVVSDLKGNVIRQHSDHDMVFQPVFTQDGTSVAYGVLDGNELWWKVEKLF